MKKIMILLLLLCLFLASCGSSDKQPEEPYIPTSYDDRVYDAIVVGKLTGPESFNEDLLLEFGAYGTDLGIMVEVKDNQVAFLFGDTFSGPNRTNFWNSNYVAFSTDKDASDGITFDSVMSKNGFAITPFMQGKHNDNNETDLEAEVTKIPTGAVTIGNTTYIFYMSVRYWGTNAGWLVTYNQCVKSTDLLNWEDVEGLRFDEEEAPYFGQIYPFKDPNSDYIYLYGIKGGRNDGLVVARVKEENFTNKDEYEYEVALNNWVKGSEGLALLKENPFHPVSGKVGEMCIQFNPYLNQYMMIYVCKDSPNGIIMQLSDNPYGMFEGRVMLFPATEYAFYGSFTCPTYYEEDGKTFYLTVSDWGPYNVFLTKVTLK